MANVTETTDAAGSTATTYSLSVGQTAQGHISPVNDSDWYRVTLVHGHTYTFAAAGEGALSDNIQDTYLYLRDSAGNQITFDDDSGPRAYSTIIYTAPTDGTYYLDVQSYNNLTVGQYGVSVNEATRPSYDADMGAGAILTPFASWATTPGTGATVTYGFRQSVPTYTVNGHPTTQSSFIQLTATEIAAVHTIMQFWSDVSGVTFTEVNPGGYTDNATILFGNYSDPNDGAGAFAFYPSGSASGGDVYLNTNSVSTSAALAFGSYSFFAIMHEVGHALGLSHPGDYNAAPGVIIDYANFAQFAQDSQQYSIMSYFDESNTGAQFNGYADTPMLLDVMAQQQLYGADMTTRTGNTIYGFSSNAGSVYDFTTNGNPAFCIWDAGGTDTLDCSGYATAQTINLTPGVYSNIGGLTQNVVIAYGATIENAIGGSAGDTIVGNSAGNILDGRGGADDMQGGAGDDAYFVDNVGDVLTESADEGNSDTVYSTINYGLGANLEFLVLQGSTDLQGSGNALNNTLYGNTGNNTLNGATGADAMYGGLGNDSYLVDNAGDVVIENVNDGSDTVYATVSYALTANVEILVLQGGADLQGYGNTLANSLYGNPGNNLLDGGAGADGMFGGAGNDAYFVDNAGDQVNENANEGTDTIYASVDYTIVSNVENLVLQGGAAQGYGNGFANTIYGNAAGNLLNGGAGADAMLGGAGNDAYFIDNAGDQVVENANEGSDTVYSTVDFGLTPNVENLVLQGSAVQGYGNSFDNTMNGNSASNLLNGGTGADAMLGGAGNDAYFVDNSGDQVVENTNDGIDTVYSTVDYALSANVENLILQGSAMQGYGNALANSIYGNTGDNLLNGGAGADGMLGGAGNDAYFVDNAGDQVVENATEGIDTVYSRVDYTLSANVENLILQGSAMQGYGNALANSIYGNTGDNLLNGGAGADGMLGGAGNDAYFVDNAGDQVVENATEGIDTVYSRVDYTLSANVENLILQGSAMQGYGNALANSIYGNASDNLLNGGAGADGMLGGAGNDAYFVDNAGDQVVENANEGIDTVYASVDVSLAANVENLVQEGSADLQGYGNALANMIYGNNGNNLLNGGASVDTLIGNAGNDIFIFNAGQGNGDTVIDFAGNGAAEGDSFLFVGYGTTAQGATFTQVGVTNTWQIHSGLDAHKETITLTNNATVSASDFLFS